MNIVSFETAKRLKEAGFPQPEFATGQIWYNSFGVETFVGKMDVSEEGTHVFFHCFSLSTARVDRIVPIHEGAFFAPSAEELLRELGQDYIAEYDGQKFVISQALAFVGLYTESEHPILVEALALAWLKNCSK